MSRSLGLLLCLMVTGFAISMQSMNIVLAEETTAKNSTYRKMREQELTNLRRLADPLRGILTIEEYEKVSYQILSIYRELGDLKGEIITLVQIANVNAMRMHHSKALSSLRLALKLAQESRNEEMEYSILFRSIVEYDIFQGQIDTNIYAYLLKRDTDFNGIEERLEYLFEKFSSKECKGSYDKYLYIEIGNGYVAKKQYSNAIEVYNKGIIKCLEFIKKNSIIINNDKSRSIFYYQYLGQLYLNLGITYALIRDNFQSKFNLDKSLSSYYQSWINRQFEDLKRGQLNLALDSFGELQEFTTVAIVTNSDSLLQKAIELQIQLQMKSGKYGRHGVGRAYEYIGNAYVAISNYNKALDYYNQAFEKYLELAPSRINDTDYRIENLFRINWKIAITNVKLTKVGDSLKSYNTAYEYLLKIRSIKAEYIYRDKIFTDTFGVGFLVDIGNFYKSMGDRDKAINFYKQADEILNKSKGLSSRGGSSQSASILSDEDDLGKLLVDTSKDRKPETTVQDPKK